MKCPFCNQQTATPRNPVPTVDIIIEVQGGIILIERKNEPRGWALPGGFADYGESFEQAAIREAKEETGLDIQLDEQLHTYSDPGRDPRMHTATTVFIARATGTPKAGDDAGRAKIFPKDRIPLLVFDHNSIVDDYLKRRGN
jgi:ADP-ribose pyrophosphatase YjhB (NUDIX family)